MAADITVMPCMARLHLVKRARHQHNIAMRYPMHRNPFHDLAQEHACGKVGSDELSMKKDGEYWMRIRKCGTSLPKAKPSGLSPYAPGANTCRAIKCSAAECHSRKLLCERAGEDVNAAPSGLRLQTSIRQLRW